LGIPTDGDKAAAATVTAELLTTQTVILYGDTDEKVKHAASLYVNVLEGRGQADRREGKSNNVPLGPPGNTAAVGQEGDAGETEPATLGSTAKAMQVLQVWCKCGHSVNLNPAEQAKRFGADLPLQPDWVSRLACSRCGSREIVFYIVALHPAQQHRLSDDF
jgi:hypothetical protein